MEQQFESLVSRYRSGEWTSRSNSLRAIVEPPSPGDIQRLPERGDAEYRALEALGREAIEAGAVGALILAGGMATRFNWDHPKGIYPILDGASFLELKIRWIREHSATMPIFIMTSFHTHEAIKAHLEEHGHFGADPSGIHLFQQYRFRRLSPDGAYFSSPDGSEDHAAPGHGDFVAVLNQTGLLQRFMAEGGRYLLFSNVDNLGASIEPAIIGCHIKSGRQMTVEVAAKLPGDKGGAPARVDGRMQLVEGFAFPADFDQDRIPVFNTATYVFTAEALRGPIELPWYVVEKRVNGQPVIQFEHLAGDLTCQLKTGFVEIDRDERFIPVKSQGEVPAAQELIRRKRSVPA
ncbi:MAG TPA: UTP--glucose-1-phosphate uridylyltransferase [Pantanalinema sp.]